MTPTDPRPDEDLTPELEQVQGDIDDARRQAREDDLLPEDEAPESPPSDADAPAPPG